MGQGSSAAPSFSGSPAIPVYPPVLSFAVFRILAPFGISQEGGSIKALEVSGLNIVNCDSPGISLELLIFKGGCILVIKFAELISQSDLPLAAAVGKLPGHPTHAKLPLGAWGKSRSRPLLSEVRKKPNHHATGDGLGSSGPVDQPMLHKEANI